MKRVFCHVVLTVSISVSIASQFVFSAQDDVFLSLTKKYESLKKLPTNVSVITSKQIEAKGAKTLNEAMAGEAGLTLGKIGTLGSNSNISMRGSTAAQVLVIVDNIRVNEVSNGEVDFGTIPVDSIERIEIIRGAASALYGGNAVGGVINIITKKAQRDGYAADFSAAYGTFDTQSYQADFSNTAGSVSYLFMLSNNRTNGYRQNSYYDNLHFFTNIGYITHGYGVFDISISKENKKLGLPGIGPILSAYNGSNEKTATTPNANQKDDIYYIRAGHTLAFRGHVINTALYTSAKRQMYYNPDGWTAEDDNYNSRSFGGDVHINTAHDATIGIEWWDEGFLHTNNLTALDVTDVSRRTSALYAQQKFSAAQLTLIPSVRVDMNSAFGNQLSPHLSAIYRLSEAFKLSSNIGLAWRAPTFNDLYWPYSSITYTSWVTGLPETSITQGNRDIKPEKAVVSDVGVEYASTNHKASVTGFLSNVEDLIQWDVTYSGGGSVQTWMPTNVSKARQSGIEAKFDHRIKSGLYHSINYTYIWAVDTTNDVLIFYKPVNTLNYRISYSPVLLTKFFADAQYISSQRTGSGTDPLPDYGTLALGVSHFVGATEVWFRLDNVTDKLYQTRYQYPLPGRTFSVGIRKRFAE